MKYHKSTYFFGLLTLIGLVVLGWQIFIFAKHLTYHPKAPIVRTPRIDDYTNVDRRSFTF